MTDEEIPIEQEKKPLKNMLKIFSVIAFIVMIMVFIIIKISKDDFPLKWFFIIGIPMFILFLITFFIFEISAKIKNRKKDVGYGRLPIAISEFDCNSVGKCLIFILIFIIASSVGSLTKPWSFRTCIVQISVKRKPLRVK